MCIRDSLQGQGFQIDPKLFGRSLQRPFEINSAQDGMIVKHLQHLSQEDVPGFRVGGHGRDEIIQQDWQRQMGHLVGLLALGRVIQHLRHAADFV